MIAAGSYIAGGLIAQVHTEGSIWVELPTIEELNLFLQAVVPWELHRLLHAVLAQQKYAVAAGSQSSGYLLDVTGPRYKLWASKTNVAVEGDLRVLGLVLELVAGAHLSPWDGVLPGREESTDEPRAPEWIDALREQHVQLLAVLLRAKLPLFERVEVAELTS